MARVKVFRDRIEAGQLLAKELLRCRENAPLVLGLPRGGVPVAREVARVLGAPLGVWVVRKVGAPGWPELGLGAVAEPDEVFIDAQTVRLVGAKDAHLKAEIERQQAEVDDRCRRFRRGGSAPEVKDRFVIVVDDGIATGGTARAALRAIRKAGATRVLLAVPVGASDTLEALRAEADDIVCLEPVEALSAIGLWYEDFATVTDDDVIAILDEHASSGATPPVPSARAAERPVRIDLGNVVLDGDLALPERAKGLVLFAHGSGSSRRSPRNRRVAEILHHAGFGTLLFDLLTAEEEEQDAIDARLRFDIDLLAQRLVAATDWVALQTNLRKLPLGYFGASTGAAAALFAAVERPAVRAVVSRGGRPDLAARILSRVRAPTMLIVGGADYDVLELNRIALRDLASPKRIEIVPGATHLFEEPGALQQVADLAARWFLAHLPEPDQVAAPGAHHAPLSSPLRNENATRRSRGLPEV